MTDALITADELRARLAAFDVPSDQQHPPTRSRKLAVALVLAGLVAMAAGAMVAARNQLHEPASPPPSATTDQAAASYRAAVAPVNAAYTTFVEIASTWNDSTTAAHAAADARPLSAAFQRVVAEVRDLASAYPSAAPALERAARAVASVEADVVALDRLNAGLSVNEWQLRFHSDVERLTVASNEVRAQLALPPALTAPGLSRG